MSDTDDPHDELDPQDPHDEHDRHDPRDEHDPHDPLSRTEVRKARREFLLDAAIEAEKDTGRREKTDDEARHSLWLRLARLVGGWLILLIGLAAIPLPGPGWLLVLLGLSLLPYRWTENLIREIRKRVPGIPEDGRIPTRTWVVMGAVIALTTGASLWWGLSHRKDDSGSSDDRAASATRPTTTAAGQPFVVATTTDPARVHLSGIYSVVGAHVVDGRASTTTTDDPCGRLRDGTADMALVTAGEMPTCFGGVVDPAMIARDHGVKLYAEVTSGGQAYGVAVRTAAIAVDDEPAEIAIDGVTERISAGADITGSTTATAQRLLRESGVLK